MFQMIIVRSSSGSNSYRTAMQEERVYYMVWVMRVARKY